MARQWRERALISPERTMVWTEPKSKKNPEKRVPVVYYLSRNGHLEHPHFMEVSLSSPHGLYLKDVVNRLNALRGRGMASLYSWSAKRSYKNGFVWQDLCGDDFIYPAHGNEYVLKGSEILNLSSPPLSIDCTSSTSDRDIEVPTSGGKKKKTPWSSPDLNNELYKVYKCELIADASTQTDDKRRSLRADHGDETEIELEISPPPSSSSTEIIEPTTKAVAVPSDKDQTVGSGRFRASAVLMQIVSCGALSVKEGSLVGVRGRQDSCRKEMDGGECSFGVEDKEYFSGSVIEMKRRAEEVFKNKHLKRSNSFNATDHVHAAAAQSHR